MSCRSLATFGGCAALFVVLLVACTGNSRAQEISFATLLRGMVDRDAVARYPTTDYRLGQASSHDRRATRRDAEGWFANADRGEFLRIEETGHGREWVVMEHDGPGALVRFWTPDRRLLKGQTEPNRTIRIYLDGAATPAIEGPWHGLFNGSEKSLAPKPLTHNSQCSAVSYLPIPFAKRCKITSDKPPAYYIFNYQMYRPGTVVKTFTMSDLVAHRDLIETVCRRLLNPADRPGGQTANQHQSLEPGQSCSVTLPDGPAAVGVIRLKLDHYTDQITRSLVLKATFDGKQTVWCPVGAFFGSGIGLNPFVGWYRAAAADGTWSCRWVMPYRQSGTVTLTNYSQENTDVSLGVSVRDWSWDERSMYFHTGWRHEYPVRTGPSCDWTYTGIEGKGVYVGDTLTVINPSHRWWGEGDAKIYFDGETFPSIFGTGTEDYYGYSYGGRNRAFYEHPFHGQIRVGNYNKHTEPAPQEYNTRGISTETRTRALDAMPFAKQFALDMEVLHHTDATMSYAAATYWYGFSTTLSNRGPTPHEARRLIIDPYRTVAGVKILNCSAGELVAQPLGTRGKGVWSNGDHLFWRKAHVGADLTTVIAVPTDGRYALDAIFTRAPDYATVQARLDGTVVAEEIDLFAPEIMRGRPRSLGVHELDRGIHELMFTITGANAKAKKAYRFGLDELRLRKVD